MTLVESLVKKPVELAFGTSGLRGLVTDMTDLECYVNVLGFVEFLKQYDAIETGATVYVAGDLRQSTPRITRVTMSAIEDAGLRVVYGGSVPTPAVAYAAYKNTAPCIMVTGSHIPADRNGIKFYKSSGEVLKEDEAAIKKCVAEVRARLYEEDFEQSVFDSAGNHQALTTLPDVTESVVNDYIDRYTSVFGSDALSGKKVVLYQHSAVGRDIIKVILEKLGAVVVAVDRSDEFVPIDTENVTKVEAELFKSFVEVNPGSFAVVSTDGDSDRPFVIDETGTFHRGDVLGIVVMNFLGARFAAVPVSANDAVISYCKDNNVELESTKIGSPYVITAMQQALASPSVGWEVNGGFLLGSDVTIENGVLSALPTRDAVLPIIAALMTAAKTGRALSEVFEELPRRYTGGGLIDDVPQNQIDQFKKLSNDKLAMQRLADQVFGNSDLGEASVDITDGLRLTFKGGNVIHLRPSGNAPQFRVYTNAGTQQEADHLVDLALAGDGYISSLLELLSGGA